MAFQLSQSCLMELKYERNIVNIKIMHVVKRTDTWIVFSLMYCVALTAFSADNRESRETVASIAGAVCIGIVTI